MKNFSSRSTKLELIDTGEYTPEEYEGCLIELRRINRFLGDSRALKKSLLREIEDEKTNNFSLLDVGAGSGELLRVCADFANKKKLAGKFFGLELNARSAKSISEQSKCFENIFPLRGDAFRLPFTDGEFNYAICSLFTHHFTDENIIKILCEMKRVANRKIFVIDLHRHPIAYYFYTTAGKVFLHNRLTRHDGALSILRSFKPRELNDLAHQANLKNILVKRFFPYRLVLQAE